jgi:hypothetical protein
MNKKIQQLADEARLVTVNGQTRYALAEEFEQRFAELIVQECAEIADTERSNLVGCGYITKTNGMRIKEHFGVKQ